MDAISKDVEQLVDKELEAANEKFPMFASAHEGYAVMLEECEETAEALALCEDMMKYLWSDVRQDNTYNLLNKAANVREYASHVAVEAIQLAAMAQKTIRSFEQTDGSKG